MKLTEERKTYIIGFLLTLVLFCQIIQSFATGKQQAAYIRINWNLSHSIKSIALLSNFSSLFVLDKENIPRNLENYKKGLNDSEQQHQQMSINEVQDSKEIEFWGQVEAITNILGIIFTIAAMLIYSNLILEISRRMEKKQEVSG